MLSHPSSVLAAVAALLVTCHAGIKCQQVPGLSGAPEVDGLRVQPCIPCFYGTMIASPEGNDLPYPQGPAGPLDPKLRVGLADLKHRLSRLEGVLALMGMIRKAGHKIFASNGKNVDFAAALQSCESAGGTLAAPRNEEENQAVLQFVKQYNQYTYLGIKESETAGLFKYLDGTSVNYTNWYSNEPRGKGTEKCVEMYTDGTWNDRVCTVYRLTVCEF